jgi:hypothetical protein
VSVLLRQADGFEGFLAGSVFAHFDNLPVPKPVHENFVNGDIDITASGVATYASRHDHVLPRISTFSCDIAYSDSPRVSRASA